MKIYNLLMGCAMLMALNSCNDWLDLTPADMVEGDELFKDGQGYRNALNGVYKQMATTSMYGCEMSWGMVDAMGQMYDYYAMPSSSAYRIVANKYEYTSVNVKSKVQAMWSKTYNSIANCNNLLNRIESESPDKFAGDQLEKDLIHGEALALRAILHFDMLRLFAPAPVKLKGNAEAAAQTYIPYYEVYPSRFEPHLTVNEVLSRVQRDLLKAKNLVAPFDTLESHRIWMTTSYRFEANNKTENSLLPTDMFYAYRGYRMHYYAICAMLARVYNYADMHQGANALAQEVIDVVLQFAPYAKTKYFEFTTGDQISKGNRKMYNDLIFALSNSKMYDIYEGVDMVNNTKTLMLGNGYYLFDDPADNRKKLTGGSTYSPYCIKYARDNSGTYAKYAEDMIPMIRLAEMYYIQAEYQMSLNNLDMAISKLDEVRMGRNCTGGMLQISSKKDFDKQLIREANREFMCEGQLFFYHKKLGNFPSYAMTKDEQFCFPLPDNEVIN